MVWNENYMQFSHNIDSEAGDSMRKTQQIKVIVHWPDTPTARNAVYEKLQKFYIEQVEKQIEKYDLTKDQKMKVLDALIHNVGEKLKTKSIM